MTLMYLWFYIIATIAFFHLQCGQAEIYENQPRIVTEHGHLYLISGENRNITLRTSGRGYVNLNDENLVQLSSMARNASETVERIRRNVLVTFQQSLSDLRSTLNGRQGIARRVAVIEASINNGSIGAGRGSPAAGGGGAGLRGLRTRVFTMNRRLTTLERQVRQIVNLLNRNECGSSPCLNGGTCEDKYSGFICRCPPNWEGPRCDIDVNECARFAGTDLGCQNGATCVNKPGTYECVCRQGFYGNHCTLKTNDCSASSSSDLCVHGVCVNQISATRGFTCICKQGWTVDAVTGACTQDIDECASNHPACSHDPPVDCINVPGSFYCRECPRGYTGNGYYCRDIDECSVNNGGCSVNPNVQCINTQGSRRCGDCPPGFQGDGVNCVYLGTCQVNNGGCHYLATCTNAGATIMCICPNGYNGPGVGPNGCVPSPGGGALSPSNPCSSNPCLHGFCHISENRPSSYYCTCMPGYTGLTCTSEINPCSSNPCQNGGRCFRSDLSYICRCNGSFTGNNCELEQQSCGGFLRTEQGNLKFPTSGSSFYPTEISCGWVIVVNSTKVINITFSSFNLEKSTTCSFDWLQIHDGSGADAHMIGRFCGDKLPKNGTIISTRNYLYLWFRSDHSLVGEGFELTWNSTEPLCGGVVSLNAVSHGVLESPGSPGKYPNNRDCYWKLISANYNKRIQFHFFTLMIESHPNCSFDYLEVLDGWTTDSPLLNKYCNSSLPDSLTTPGPAAMVHFHSDESGNDYGFKISYTLIEGILGCGGVLTGPAGSFSSPNHPDTYRENMECEWKIQLPVGERIQLTFLAFSLEDSNTCKFDFVEVRDGDNIDSPLIGRYCGSQLPPIAMSTSNNLVVKFRSDWSYTAEGFRISFQSICGGTFSDLTGTIHSPYYPRSYPTNKICIYHIALPPGKAIQLTFQDFDVEDTSYPTCSYDHVQIRDGDNENSTLIGTYCGEDNDMVPPPVLSTHNYLWIKFKTDSSVQNKGFLANYSSVDVLCGGIYKSSSGTIQTPAHPEVYPPGTECQWVISTSPGKVIQLTFTTFNLEGSSFSTDCPFDSVTVYDNSSLPNTGGLMGKFCGNTIPPVLTSVGNMITVDFKADFSRQMEGFSANFITIDTSKMCGGSYFSATGIIRSPNYPNGYPRNKNCVWKITAPSGQQIMLNVTDFELENHHMCYYDFLEIKNGGYENSPLLGKFCGTTITKIMRSFSNQIYIHFVSDSSNSLKGFSIHWDATTTGCGGTLASSSGSIISPNYPQPYNHKAECLWKVIVSRGSAIQMVFVDLDLENQASCLYDYVEVRDGIDSSAKRIGRYCTAGSHPLIIRSTGNHLFVKFRSDVSRSGRGFHIKFDTVCNNIVKGYRGVIESPNFPRNYPGDMDCTWNITATQGNKLNLTFSNFELESFNYYMPDSGNHCTYDYVEVKAGSGSDPPTQVLGKFCGQDIPAPISSTTDHIYIHFVTDSFTAYSGFRIEWVLNGCGNHFEYPQGVFTTPNYPNGYPVSTTCEWLITVDWGKSVEVTIDNFDLEGTVPHCQYDALRVYGGPDDTAPLLGELCTNQKVPIKYTSSGENMYIRFISDSSFAGKGFRASYKTVDSHCGGKMMAPFGQIHSSNYPDNYGHNDDCMWYIEVDQSHVVKLSFIDFDIEAGYNCSYDYLRIFDGNTTDSPILLTHCGNQLPNQTTIKSTGNKMTIRMKSDGSRSAKGFLANYTMSCGARIVTEESGMIRTQESLNVDSSNSNCSWVIMGSQPDDHVTLTFTHISVPEMDFGSECSYYYIEVRDGEDKDSPQIGKYCSSRVPAHITSQGSALFVQAVAVYGYHFGSFEATYSVLSSACGGNLTSEHGSFASPGYPNSYPVNAECVWVITTSPGNRAQVSFQMFDLENNCAEDYVEVRRDNATGPLMGEYCGNTIPSNLTASHSLWVKFRSSDAGTAGGFIADYSLLHGNELFGASGQVASPLYPHPYFHDGTYSWRITVQFGKAITIRFKDFYVPSYVSDICYSSLKVYDGYDDTAPILLERCGIQLPDPVTSSANIVYISLDFNLMRTGIWFLLEWQQVNKQGTSTGMMNPSQSSVPGCGGSFSFTEDFNVTSYNFTSPGYPLGYEHNLNCEWIIQTPPGFHLQLVFNDVNLVAYDPCDPYDYVKVFSGDNGKPDFKPVGTFCKRNATQVPPVTTTNIMKVVFHSDMFMNNTGFSATVVPVCGGLLFGPSGYIDMMNKTKLQPDSWRFYFQCQWNITVRTGRTIAITFEEFKVISTDTTLCQQSSVVLRNGGSSDSPPLGDGKYCGTTIPVVNQTTGNKLFVKYSANKNSVGFKLRYQEVSLDCGGRINLTPEMSSVNISSPRYPNIPNTNSECEWIIMAPGGERIHADFIDRFDFAYSFRCTKEYVELFDGGSQNAKLLGRYCTRKPSSLLTTGNMLTVHYFTETTDPHNGFLANIAIATCGGTLRDWIGTLTSPSYPGSYPTNQDCTWLIEGVLGHYLIITFQEIRILRMSDCSADYVEILESVDYNNTEVSLGKFCGNTPPASIRTSGNVAKVVLHAGPSTALHGMTNVNQRFKLSYNTSRETCGDELNTPSGIITSPGYPSSNMYRRTCTWKITVPKGRRITVEVLDYDVDIAGMPGIWFFNDFAFESLIARYTTDTIMPTSISSTSNVMEIYFSISRHMGRRGIKLRYTSDLPAVCGGDLTGDSGYVSSPPESLNLSSYYCIWERVTPSTANETLTFTVLNGTFGTKPYPSCIFYGTHLSIRAAADEIKLADVCANATTPLVYPSPFSMNKVLATQNLYETNDKMNFTLKYSSSPCGGVLNGPEETVSSPNYPNNYPPNTDCAWSVSYPEGQAIKIHFISLNMEADCEKDNLLIHSGHVPSSPRIGRYCGNSPPTDIISHSNTLWIAFHSDAETQGQGFQLTLEPVTGGCGGIIIGANKEISTPNFPKTYLNNAECDWEIRVDDGYTIQLDFVERFYIENSDNCQNDFVETFNYIDEQWVSLGRQCGRNIPASIKGTTNKMRVLFRSNGQIQADGFKARWKTNCGGVITNKTFGHVMSPGYPLGYSNNLNCNYTFIFPGKSIQISFLYFDVEQNHKDCRFDNVTVLAQQYSWTTMMTELGSYCGNNIPPVIVQRNRIEIIFKTDRSLQKTGFLLQYEVETCGGNITEQRLLKSPASNNQLNSRVRCNWLITAPLGKRVTLRFTSLKIEYHTSCNYDYIEAYDDKTTNKKHRMGRYCGNLDSNPPKIHSTGRYLSLLFVTDGSNQGEGFLASVMFTTVCGGIMNVSQRMQTLRYPVSGKYAAFLDCAWTLVAPLGQIVQLQITSLDMASCFNMSTASCDCDYLEVHDGVSQYSELIGRFCGNTAPPAFTSSSNKMWIHFVSDGTENGNGFQMQVSSIASICGNSTLNVTSSLQELTSPNYPGNYPVNIRCRWLLTFGPVGNRWSSINKIYIHFKELDLETGGDDCRNDRLQVSDINMNNNRFISEGLEQEYIFSGQSSDGTSVYYGSRQPAGKGTFCGHGEPLDYYSDSANVQIVFVSNFNVTARGFKIQYGLQGCRRNYTGVQGRIKLKADVDDCIITIQAQPNHTISLYFLEFYSMSSDGCNNNFLEVRDGLTPSSPRLAKLCGSQIPSPIFSNTSALRLFRHQKSAFTGSYDVIDITYTTTDQGPGCGGTLFNFGGVFTSPFYPGNYRNNSKCRWDVMVPTGLTVVLKFYMFDLGSSVTCDSDYIEFFDFDVVTKVESFRTKYCGGDVPAVYEGVSAHVVVRYTSSVHNGGTGWVLHFMGKVPGTHIFEPRIRWETVRRSWLRPLIRSINTYNGR